MPRPNCIRLFSLTLLLVGLWHPTTYLMADATAQPEGDLPGPLAVATFAGGCFWCMEPPFDKIDGVISTVSGYTGGHLPDPDYKAVSRGKTGHAEALQVTFDPARVDYATLLEVFWRNIDPLVVNRQFCDVGPQYRTAIFVHDADQAALAAASRDRVAARFAGQGAVATEIVEAGVFYPAEDYHQDYYVKNPLRYKQYRHGCGRDRRLKQLWPDD